MEHEEISGAKERSCNSWVFAALPSNYLGFYAKVPSCHYTMFIFLPTTTKAFIGITNKQKMEVANTPTNDNRLTNI